MHINWLVQIDNDCIFFKALGQAVNLAFSIAKFPLASLNHDRNSLLQYVYEHKQQQFEETLNKQLNFEKSHISKEIWEGVQRFKACKIIKFKCII